MPFNSILLTSSYLFVAALLLCSGEHNVLGQASDVRDCEDYTGANTTHATCNEEPGVICSGGCTGYVTATNCTRSQQVNVQEPPITTEKCTLGFGKSSATMYICINEQFSFTCYGASTGKAQCKGCHQSNGTSQPDVSNGNNGPQNMTMAPTTPANDTSPMGSMGASGANSTVKPSTSLTGNSSSMGTTDAPASPTTTTNTTTSSATTSGANVFALVAASIFASALV